MTADNAPLNLARAEFTIGLFEDLEKTVANQSRRDRAQQPVTVFLPLQSTERSRDTGRVCRVVAPRGIDQKRADQSE